MEINVFSQHAQALQLRALRNEVLASNIANADTPGYKARDLDFASALQQVQGGSLRMVGTSERHMQASGTSGDDAASSRIQYRVPMQSTLDGNTVETDVEQAAFAENALMYRASLAFLDGRIRSIRYALKGGD